MSRGDLRVRVNTRKLNRSVKATNRRFAAIRGTLNETGRGQVVVSARKKIPRDPPGRAVHGRAIANFLRKEGKDPFDHDIADEAAARNIVTEHISRARDQAFHRGVQRRAEIKAGLLEAAELLAEAASDDLESGRFGQKKMPKWVRGKGQNQPGGSCRRRWLNYWRGQASKGAATLKYGNPPPYGIRSGRFLEGIRAVWRQGRPRGGRR